MADAKSSVPTKSQITYANGVVLLERRDGNIKIFFRDGDLLAEGKIIEREKDGSILFTSKESGNLMKLDPDGTVGFVPIETTTELKPRPNIR